MKQTISHIFGLNFEIHETIDVEEGEIYDADPSEVTTHMMRRAVLHRVQRLGDDLVEACGGSIGEDIMIEDPCDRDIITADLPDVKIVHQDAWTYLDLSTVHVRPADMGLLAGQVSPMIAQVYPEGAWVHVPSEEGEWEDLMEEWLESEYSFLLGEVLKLARSMGVQKIRLDADGTLRDDLEQCDEWGEGT